jgi:membrane protein YdbS with pleckstrin-like domain
MSESVVTQLQKIPLFARLGEDDLRAIAGLVKRAEYPAGTEISRQGHVGVTAYLVETGQLRVLQVDPQGIEQEIDHLGPGAFFGETSLLLVGEVRDATIEVVQDAVLLYLNKEDFDQLVYERPSLLRSLRVRPEIARRRKVRRFKWQDADEVVVLSLHKHGVLLTQHLLFPALVMLVGVGCFYWFLRSDLLLFLILGVPLVLAPLALSLYLYVDYTNDDYTVTNKRVVHEERVPLIRESRAEAPLHTIQDIQQSQEGPLAKVFDFGDLIIETAGERGHVVFRRIPHPGKTREIIFEQIQRVQSGARAEERAAIRDVMRRHFGITAPAGTPAMTPARRKGRFKLALPGWLTAPLRIFRYFLPSLRYEQGDTITWRKHWVTLIGTITLPTVLILAATGVAIFLVLESPTHPIPILIGYGTVMVFLFPWWLWRFEDWQNDIYQVTSTRIIDVERLPFFLRETRREAGLGKIQNITLEVHGVLGRLLDYGSVRIETAGGGGALVFSNVKNPRGVQAEIFRRVEAFQRRQRQEEAERRRTELLDWFSVYDGLRRPQPTAAQPASSPQQES